MTLSNQKLQSLRSLRQKKSRDRSGHYLIEGLRLCEEAVDGPATVLEIIIADGQESPRLQQLLQRAGRRAIPILHTTQANMDRLCDTDTPQAVAALVAKASPCRPDDTSANERLILAVDQLQDPGNLGTLLRTADWFGVKTVLISRDSVDLYNPKVVRASMGSIFRLTCCTEVEMRPPLARLRERGYRLLAAVTDAAAPLTLNVEKTVLLVGNEANGISAGLVELADHRFTIPRLGGGESLNAAIAAGIALYELTKR